MAKKKREKKKKTSAIKKKSLSEQELAFIIAANQIKEEIKSGRYF